MRRPLGVGLGAGLGVFGLVVIVLGLVAPSAVPVPPLPVPGHSFGQADPDSYRGTPIAPAEFASSTVYVPDIGLRATIVDETTDQNGYLVMPEPSLVARYARAAALGAARGSTVLAGHVNYADGAPAPMASLAGVTKGMPVYVTDVNGTPHRYRITGLQNLPKMGLPASIFALDGPAQLVLMTCDQTSPIAPVGGVVQFTENKIATAVPWP